MSKRAGDRDGRRILLLGVGAIAIFFAVCILVILAATRDEGAASSTVSRPAAATPYPVGGASSFWQPGFTSGEHPPAAFPTTPPVDAATRREAAIAAAAAQRTAQPTRPEEMEAVNWKREKPPRSAEDLE